MVSKFTFNLAVNIALINKKKIIPKGCYLNSSFQKVIFPKFAFLY